MNEFTIDANDVKFFISEYNHIRRRNKNKWFVVRACFNGKWCNIKAYNTWIQVFACQNWKDGGVEGASVSKQNQQLTDWISKL